MRLKKHMYRVSYKNRRGLKPPTQNALRAHKLYNIRRKKGQCTKCGTQLKGNGRRMWKCPKCDPLKKIRDTKKLRKWRILDKLNMY